MFKKIKDMLAVPEKHKKEYYFLLRKYNNSAGTYYTLFSILMILIVSAIMWLFGVQDGYFGKLLPLITPPALTMLASSIVTAVTVWVVRKRFAPSYKLSEIALFSNYVICVIMLWSCYEFDASFSLIRSSSLPIFTLFVLVFFMRFRLSYTIFFQTAVSLFYIIMTLQSPISVRNMDSTVIYLVAAYCLSVVAACTFWSTNLKSFLSEKNYESLLTSDFLTKVYNRRGFDSIYSRVWNDASRKKTPLTLLIIDVDFFKKYNDIYGHVEGDHCIIRVANTIATSVRVNDYVARYGGEEFAVVMSEADTATAESVSKRIFENMAKLKIPHAESVTPYVSVSIGVSTIYPADGTTTADDLVRRADAALYRAKALGRNRIEFDSDL